MRSECEAAGGASSELLASPPCPSPPPPSPFPSRGSREPGFSHRRWTSRMTGAGCA